MLPSDMLNQLIQKRQPRIFNVQYSVPQEYSEALRLVPEGSLKLLPSELWRAPLRYPNSFSEERKLLEEGVVNTVHFLSYQHCGDEGIVAQHLMQPTESVFRKSFVALTLEDMELNPENSMGDIYLKMSQLGLERCPVVIAGILSITGLKAENHDMFVFVTKPIKGKTKSGFLFAFFGDNRPGYRSTLDEVYADPEMLVSEIASDRCFTLHTYEKVFEGGEFKGLFKPPTIKGGGVVQKPRILGVHNGYFVFMLPDRVTGGEREDLVISPKPVSVAG